jgi:uncharacterized membrane protein YfcA
MVIFGLGLAALVGLSLGLLGGGGSILTVPIFVYVLGFGAKEAIAMSLAVVGTTSLFGVVGHWRAGNVNPRVALFFGVVTMVGAFLGSRLAVFFSDTAQLTLFAVIMLLASYFMFRGRRPARAGDEERATPQASLPLVVLTLAGLVVGVLTGLVGVGGGFLIVPALVLLARVPMREAVGTSLLVIALNAATGFAGYLGRVEVAWALMGGFTAIAAAGILVGTRLVRHVPQEALRRAFAIFLVLMGGFVLYQNLGTRIEPREPVTSAEISEPVSMTTISPAQFSAAADP